MAQILNLEGMLELGAFFLKLVVIILQNLDQLAEVLDLVPVQQLNVLNIQRI